MSEPLVEMRDVHTGDDSLIELSVLYTKAELWVCRA